MKEFALGICLCLVGLWGGSFALHFLPEYLRFAAYVTSLVFVVSGGALIGGFLARL